MNGSNHRRIVQSCALALALALALAASVSARAGEKADDEELTVKAAPAASAPSAGTAAPAARPSSPATAAEPGVPVASPAQSTERPAWLEPYTVTGYVQGEYQSHQDSDDQLQQGGTPLNKDRFLLRRARLKVDGDWRYAHLQLEADGNTNVAPQLRVLHAFATLKLPQLRESPGTKDVPIAAVSLGLFDTPFGYELLESPRTRFFMERTTQSRAFYPGEPDVGMKLHGGLYFVRWSIAAMNGEPLDEKSGFAGVSPHSAKDVIFKLGVDTHPMEKLGLTANVSTLRGRGFHPGTDATKNLVTWRDTNEDGQIQPSELTGQPATAATPSQNFTRWAVGADVQARLRTWLGETLVYGELTVASNMDRGLYVADPVLTGTDIRELGYYVGVVQEVTEYGVVGFRYDSYDPNSDFLDKRSGRIIPQSLSVQTFSPLVGLVLPNRARLLFQYDIIRDHFARDDRGLPADLKNDAWTLRLQVQL